MKKYISYLAFALAVVLTVGCIKIDVQQYQPNSMATLVLKNTDLVQTRADEVAGDKGLNENYIDKIQCFFLDADDAVVCSTGIVDVDLNDEGNGVGVAIELSTEDLEDVFADGASDAKLYVVANVATEITAGSLEDIQETVITLATNAEEAQPSFVMDGIAYVTKDADNKNKIEGTVYLRRAAAKIVVDLQVENEIVIGEGELEETWVPILTGVEITYNNAVTSSTLNVEAGDASVLESLKQESNPFTFTRVEGAEYSVGTQNMPFYSYPHAWGSAVDKNAANILLVIPWKKEGDEDSECLTYRYQIPVNLDNKELKRNNIYKLSAKVGILGTLNGTIDLNPSYIVVDWQSQSINTELSRPQYLVVDQKYVEMNNVEEFSVGYASSDPVGVEIISSTVHEWEYQRASDGNQYIVSGAADTNESVALENGAIVYRHNLDNTRDDGEYDFLVQEITVCIYHKTTEETNAENATIKEYVTFKQYPAMYVDTGESVSGSVFVNGNQDTTELGDDDNWAYVGSGSQGMSSNMYKITVKAFDASTSQYRICDPREDPNSDQFSFNSVTTAKDVSGDNTLTGYRATIVGQESANLVAPEFIVASGYGFYQVSWSNMNAKTTAKYRCAGYQEAGYPAGRWRVPTPAELEIIGKLCAEGKIPSIFYGQYSYMSSNGPYYYNSDGTFRQDGDVDTNGDSIRCVYDTWYWKDKCKEEYVDDFLWAAEGDTANKSKYLE